MFFKVIIKKNSGDKVAISGDKIEESSESFICNADKAQLSSAEDKIICYLKEHESITNKKAREVTGLSSSGVRKIFEGLVQKKLITAFGDKKSRCYKL